MKANSNKLSYYGHLRPLYSSRTPIQPHPQKDRTAHSPPDALHNLGHGHYPTISGQQLWRFRRMPVLSWPVRRWPLPRHRPLSLWLLPPARAPSAHRAFLLGRLTKRSIFRPTCGSNRANGWSARPSRLAMDLHSGRSFYRLLRPLFLRHLP